MPISAMKFPPPFAGVRYQVQFKDNDQLLAAIHLLVNESDVSKGAFMHVHNFAIEMGAFKPTLWLSKRAVECVIDDRYGYLKRDGVRKVVEHG